MTSWSFFASSNFFLRSLAVCRFGPLGCTFMAGSPSPSSPGLSSLVLVSTTFPSCADLNLARKARRWFPVKIIHSSYIWIIARQEMLLPFAFYINVIILRVCPLKKILLMPYSIHSHSTCSGISRPIFFLLDEIAGDPTNSLFMNSLGVFHKR